MEKVMIDESWLAESYISAQKTMEREAGKYLSTSGDGRWVLDLFTFYLDDEDYGDFCAPADWMNLSIWTRKQSRLLCTMKGRKLTGP